MCVRNDAPESCSKDARGVDTDWRVCASNVPSKDARLSFLHSYTNASHSGFHSCPAIKIYVRFHKRGRATLGSTCAVSEQTNRARDQRRSTSCRGEHHKMNHGHNSHQFVHCLFIKSTSKPQLYDWSVAASPTSLSIDAKHLHSFITSP